VSASRTLTTPVLWSRVGHHLCTHGCLQVIGLAAGQPDFATPRVIAAAGKAAIDAGKTTYTPNVGTAALQAAIVNKLRCDNGLEYSESSIVVSNGAKQSIWQAILACVSPGDEVIVPAPYWVSYPEMVRLAGGSPRIIPTNAASGFLMSPEQLRAALNPRTRAVILCSPSNPSGAVYSRSQLEALAEVIIQHPRALVISDEIYELIIYPPAEHVSFAGLPGMWERTVTVNGASKAFAMTGWRIGYAAAPQHFAKAMAVIQSQSTSGACSISQVRHVAHVSV
jgi:bifunctional aspartate aminotransferase and glutamate/aspartate-prephenate aminotransferase